MIEETTPKEEGAVETALPPCDISDCVTDGRGEIFVVVTFGKVSVVTTALW